MAVLILSIFGLMIRPAKITDLPAIAEIYNDAILNTTAVFHTDMKDMDYYQGWFSSHDEKHPAWVYELDDECVGFVSLSAWSDKCGYDGTQEISVYVQTSHRGKGIGKQLMQAMIEHGTKLGVTTILSRIEADNKLSIQLHSDLGFTTIGTMHKVGYKFNKFLDVVMMQYVY